MIARAGKLALAVALCVGALCAAGCNPTEDQVEDNRLQYAIDVRLKFSPSFFEPLVPPRYVPQPFDIGFVNIFHPIRELPAQWQYSQTTEDTKISNVFTDSLKPSGPVFIHPDATYEIGAKVSLPAHICAQVFVMSPDEALPGSCGRGLAGGLTSACAALPSSLDTTSFEEAKGLLPEQHEMYPEVVELEIDTAVEVDQLINILFIDFVGSLLCQ